MKLHNDPSVDKVATARTHWGGTVHSASIGSFSNKTDGMRVEVYEPITEKTYYFVFPYASYKHLSETTTMEIPFKTDGTPYRKHKWWNYEVGSWANMCTTVINNNSTVSHKSTFNSLYEED
jgi:hypothetical protein